MSAVEGGTGHAGRGHAVLLVEDDPTEAAILVASIRSRGDTPYLVGTVEEALLALEARQYCYCIVDQQLPTDASDRTPMLGGGECVMGAIRAKDGRLNARKCHVTPILVVTGYTAREDFVSKMYELGCDAFLSKPLKEKVEVLLDRVREMTRRAGRGEHAACGELNRGAGPWRVPGEGSAGVVGPVVVAVAAAATVPVVVAPGPAVASSPQAVVKLVIDGKRVGSRTIVEVNGQERPMQDSKFVALLRLVVAREKNPLGWGSREELGLVGKRNVTTAVREVFEGALAEGVNAVEGDGRGEFRLNLGIEVERVNWAGLRGHPSFEVRKVAEKRGR
jgi:CheY-like chemotaxis protein